MATLDLHMPAAIVHDVKQSVVHPLQDDDIYCTITMMSSCTLVPYCDSVLEEVGMVESDLCYAPGKNSK